MFSTKVNFLYKAKFEKLVNNRLLDHLEKCGPFSDFQLYLVELLGVVTGLELLEL